MYINQAKVCKQKTKAKVVIRVVFLGSEAIKKIKQIKLQLCNK